MRKKHLLGIGLLGIAALSACGTNTVSPSNQTSNTSSAASSAATSSVASSTNNAGTPSSTIGLVSESSDPNSEYNAQLKELQYKSNTYLANLSAGGVVEGKLGDFRQYENTSAYVEVSTAAEFIDALTKAKYTYTNDSINDDGTINQTLTAEGTVHVIEITQDLDLGYNTLINAGISSSIVKSFDKNNSSYGLSKGTQSYKYDDIVTSGISQICIENTSNLLIYSKNGAKIKHAGFKLTSDYNIVVRNLDMDEIWMWEDANTLEPTFKVGDYDNFGWAYFKISFSEAVWIDHCSFGKSYDGQIDVSNPVYNTTETLLRAPYGATTSNGTHISYCDFHGGDDSEDGYIYKMMSELEDNYQAYLADNSTTVKGYYYKTLRDAGLSFDDVMKAYALPQKKGFLLADSGDDYNYNKELKVSFSSCTFKNLEDRLPKIRSGIAYLYNCYVDNSEYYAMLSKISAISTKITNASTKFKAGGVSQGALSGLGGSVYMESVVYTGIKSFLKNNDTSWDTNKNYTDDVAKYGGYKIINSYFYNDTNSMTYGSSTADTDPFTNINVSLATLDRDHFSFHTDDETIPFPIVPFYKNEKGYNWVTANNYSRLAMDYFVTEPTGAGVFNYDLMWTTTDYKKA